MIQKPKVNTINNKGIYSWMALSISGMTVQNDMPVHELAERILASGKNAANNECTKKS